MLRDLTDKMLEFERIEESVVLMNILASVYHTQKI
ncbi:rCG61162 [Rattus norvegicus]|uniref:RCG61162 n=1 Tax=Rattus norvegicus TaxID=10116 RepID=A6KE33_RAT|nr:rCG61162 [Rattus norvegicus]